MTCPTILRCNGNVFTEPLPSSCLWNDAQAGREVSSGSHFHPVVYHCVILLYGRQHNNRQVDQYYLLTRVYYSVFAACFDPVGSSSGSSHDTSLSLLSCGLIWTHINNCIDISKENDKAIRVTGRGVP
jgi:hypothetical protein